MNNWWIVLLLLCFCNNGRSGCDWGCGRSICRNQCDDDCRPDFGCQDSLIQPRGFFQNTGTCGCETKSE